MILDDIPAVLAAPARKAHAKSRPPSAASRWLSCPASVVVVPLYPNDESDASVKGDKAHDLLDTSLKFGIKPDTDDPDMDMNVIDATEWVHARRAEYGDKCRLYVEEQLDIPETGEFGTADIQFVTPSVLHIADFKNGYVPVEIFLNAQMMTYLLGAIAKHGERKTYRITVLQPNYNHRDGPYRTMDVTHDQVEWFREEVLRSVNADDEDFRAGKHCKKTYCPHRGSCLTFQSYARTELANAYFPGEINGMDDVQLSQALDHAEILQGLRDELRKEGLRRIANQDRKIPGFKVVKARSQRSFAGDAGREGCFKALVDLGYNVGDLVERKAITTIDGAAVYEQVPLTVAGVERLVKQKCKPFGNGKWKEVWDEHFRPHVRDFSGSLTLERETDGRPAHSRGSEFGALTPATSVNTVI